MTIVAPNLLTKAYIGLLFTSLIISGCATTANPSQQKVHMIKDEPYKRIIQISSDNQQLKTELEDQALKLPNILVNHEDDFSEFRLVINSSLEHVKSLDTKPKLFGLLKKEKTPINFSVNYTLTNTSKHVLTTGELSSLTETQSTIYPRLVLDSEIPADVIKETSTKVLKETIAHIQTTPWNTAVIGQKDLAHVTIGAGESADIKIGDRFITETQPVAFLEAVLYETTPAGEERTVLRLIDGHLPTAGRTLIPHNTKHSTK